MLLNAQGAEFRQWLDDLAAGRRIGRGDARVIGALDQPTLDALAQRAIQPQSGAITIKDQAIAHMTRDAKRAPVPMETIRRLPELMASPKAILRDRRDDAVIYVLDIEGEQARKLIVFLDVRQKAQTPVGRARFTANAVRTATEVATTNLSDPNLYEVISGSLE